MPPHLFDNWHAQPFSKASARVLDREVWRLICVEEIASARAAGLPVTFRFPVSHKDSNRP